MKLRTFAPSKPQTLLILLSVLYLSVIGVGVYMPMMSDEIAELFLLHRAIIDNYSTISLTRQCGESFATPLAYSSYIPAFLSHVTYTQIDDPIQIRWLGIGRFFIWLAILFPVAIKLLTPSREQVIPLCLIILAFLSLDAMPLLYLVNRPEGTLVLGLTFMLALVVFRKDIAASRSLSLILTLLMFVNLMIVHRSHAMAVVFTPFELCMGYVFLKSVWRSGVVSWIGVGVIAWIGADAYIAGTVQYVCDDETIRKGMGRASVDPFLWLNEPIIFLKKIIMNWALSLITDIYLDASQVGIRSLFWIPHTLHTESTVMTLFGRLLAFCAWLLKFSLLMYLYFCFFKMLHSFWHKEQGETPLKIGFICLIIAMTGIFMVYGPMKLFYRTALIVPLLLLLLLITLRVQHKKSLLYLPKFYVTISVFALLNLLVLLYQYSPYIRIRQDYTQRIKNVQGMERLYQNNCNMMPSTFVPWPMHERKRDIATSNIATACGIRDDQSMQHLMLDDYTYFPFRHSYQPLHIQFYRGFFCQEFPESLTEKFWSSLREYKSDGLIVDCRNLPEELLPFAKQEDGICCIPKEAWE